MLGEVWRVVVILVLLCGLVSLSHQTQHTDHHLLPEEAASTLSEDVPETQATVDYTGEAREKVGAVWALRREGHLESFVSPGSVSIVYFYRKSGSVELSRFLTEYSLAAADLLSYHVHLATVDCSEYPAMPYCGPDKVDHFAYGFRDAQEKIAFPLDTLFNTNAIVASALHLAQINSVPILQTATERRDLEARCKGRCNIVFAFLRTLGTLEHRMFLEVAYAHQEDFVFAITTYTAGTLGLTASPSHDVERESSVWAVHCRDKRPDQECVVSHFRDRMDTAHLTRFLTALTLPLWHELKGLSGSSDLVTPYDASGLPWVILIYDTACMDRVKSLAPHLAQLLHGSIATFTLDLSSVGDPLLRKLGLVRHTLTPPTIAFYQTKQELTSLLNDYDDPLTWVKEQLEALEPPVENQEPQPYLPVQPLEELQHDDETVLGMVGEERFDDVRSLAGPERHQAALASDSLPVIAYYLAWDPVSNALLQHLSLLVPALSVHHSTATVYRVNCFHWPHVCQGAGIQTYPVLRLHPRGRHNVTYDGQIHRDFILRAVLLLEKPTPLKLSSRRELEALMRLDRQIHPACSLVTAATIAILPRAEDGRVFKKAVVGLETSHLTALHISATASHNICGSGGGCVVVSKPSDRFQPQRILTTNLLLDQQPQAITAFIKHASLPVMGELEPDRYHTLLSGAEGDTQATLRHLFIFFMPHNYTHTQEGQTTHTRPNLATLVYDDDWGNKIGQVAAQLTQPHLLFSWLFCEDPLAVELLKTYDLPSGVRSLVALTITPSSKSLYVFPATNTSTIAFTHWAVNVRDGLLQPQVKLPEGDWQPQLEGFDFLKFMQEDQDRDAEDHLILEMEADLASQSTPGGSDESKKHLHEEL